MKIESPGESIIRPAPASLLQMCHIIYMGVGKSISIYMGGGREKHLYLHGLIQSIYYTEPRLGRQPFSRNYLRCSCLEDLGILSKGRPKEPTCALVE